MLKYFWELVGYDTFEIEIDPQQRHLKFLLMKQIKLSNLILQPITQKVKFVQNEDIIKSSYLNNEYVKGNKKRKHRRYR